nr:hypothetical protein [candidate division Zixibacteria bacterium]
MSFSSLPSRLNWTFLLVCAIIVLAFSPTVAQFPDLVVQVGDTTAMPGEQNTVISVFAKNYADTVAGFEVWLLLNKNYICEFQTDTATFADTTYYSCISWNGPDCEEWRDITDSVILDPLYPYDSINIDEYPAVIGNFDTTGTLISGWEYVRSNSMSGGPYDIKVVGQANQLKPPYTTGIGYPQVGEKPLFKILADVYDIPDEMTDRTVTIYVQATTADNFSFSDEKGNAIGILTDTIYDTTWYECLVWEGGICTLWEEVEEGPTDSFVISDTILNGHIDTSKVYIFNGSLTIELPPPYDCGDVNCSNSVNILDATYMINYLYRGGPAPCVADLMDVNCDTKRNILDATYLINYLYRGGPSPHCPPGC